MSTKTKSQLKKLYTVADFLDTNLTLLTDKDIMLALSYISERPKCHHILTFEYHDELSPPVHPVNQVFLRCCSYIRKAFGINAWTPLPFQRLESKEIFSKDFVESVNLLEQLCNIAEDNDRKTKANQDALATKHQAWLDKPMPWLDQEI